MQPTVQVSAPNSMYLPTPHEACRWMRSATFCRLSLSARSCS